VTLSSVKEALPDITVHRAKEGIKGDKKRCKQRPQETMTTTDHDDGNEWEAGGFDVRRISITANSDKHQARPPTDLFKRLLEEACPIHAYPIMHKFKDYDMMWSFMTLGSLTWGAELDEDPGGSDTMPFPRENAVSMVYGGCPHRGGASCLT
jgi:hypothetical protein